MPFESPDKPLHELMSRIRGGEIQLPDFQREWKWDTDRIGSLLASVSLGYPVGVVMMLQVGGASVNFAPRPIAGVPAEGLPTPGHLLLDGQQRLTSLYRSLASGEAVDTSDAKGKPLRRHYYIDMRAALDPEVDREDAIVAVPADRVIKTNFGKDVELDLSSTELECQAEMFPLRIAFDYPATTHWQMKYLQGDPARMEERLNRWFAFCEQALQQITGYVVPVIVLTQGTPKEAVCLVFEKVNTGGVALNVFELLTATFAAEDFRLNDDWRARRERIARQRVLRSIESTDFLQAVALAVSWNRKRAALEAPPDGALPAVSCRRKDILNLSLADYLAHADAVEAGFLWAAQLMNGERIFAARDLPYRTQLVPLAAIHAILGNDAETLGAVQKITRWYWCGVLGELYGGAIETRFARDVEQVVEWIRDPAAPEPRTVTEASFEEGRLLTLRTRNAAAYKGVYALLMRGGCRDWLKHQDIDMAAFFDHAVDIHHVFPQAWCKRTGVDPTRMDCIVNKTPLAASTNRTIGGLSPAQYVKTLKERAGISDGALDEVIAAHAIEPAHLRSADFGAFFAARSEALLALVSAAMGREALRTGPGPAPAGEYEPDQPEPDEPEPDEPEPDEPEPAPLGG